MKKVVLLLVATVAVGTGTAFAATLSVGSHHLWTGSQTLTKATCTLTGSTATTDTYVDENKPTTSFGTTTTALVQPDSGSRKWMLVRFDLSTCSIPTTGGADTATLSLRVTTAPKTDRVLAMTPVAATWSNTTTWNSVPSFAATTTTTFHTGTANNATVSIPVTIDVDDLIKSSTANYGWRISDTGSAATQDTTTFATSNATSNRPTLVIDYEK